MIGELHHLTTTTGHHAAVGRGDPDVIRIAGQVYRKAQDAHGLRAPIPGLEPWGIEIVEHDPEGAARWTVGRRGVGTVVECCLIWTLGAHRLEAAELLREEGVDADGLGLPLLVSALDDAVAWIAPDDLIWIADWNQCLAFSLLDAAEAVDWTPPRRRRA